jgi:2'-5' RNA ligase
MKKINEGNNGDNHNNGYLGLHFRIDEQDWETHLINYFDKDDLSEEHGIEEEPHITVLFGFLPHITAADMKPHMTDKVITIDDIRISGMSLFENDKYDVVKLDIESEKLHRYNKYLKDNIENECTFPDYQPHITLAYVKVGTGQKYIGQFSGIDLIAPLKAKLEGVEVYYTFSDPDKKETTFSIRCGA